MGSIVDANLYNTLDFLPEGYFIIDDTFDVIYWNKTLELMTGVTKDEITNKKLQDYFKNFDREIIKRRIAPLFIGGPPVIFSAKLHKTLFSRDESTEQYYQVTITSLRFSKDKCLALFSVENRNEIYSQINELIHLRDKALNEIDEKEQIHSQLYGQHIKIQEAFETLSAKNQEIEKQKQQLLELNATKDKFFSIIAHDLINPFSFIMGYSSLLYDKFDSYSPGDAREMARMINQASQQTYDLLQNLLQWSQAQSKRIENNPIKILLIELFILLKVLCLIFF